MAAIPEEFGHDLGCVLLPVGALSLLLPSVSVAEVLPWRRVKAVADAPPWLLGAITWRGNSIPVLRFEPLNGSTDIEPSAGRCVTVVNRCGSSDGQPFYALATDALPRMVQVGADDLKSQSQHLGAAEMAAAKLGTEHVRVPNLSFIESQLNGLIHGQAFA